MDAVVGLVTDRGEKSVEDSVAKATEATTGLSHARRVTVARYSWETKAKLLNNKTEREIENKILRNIEGLTR